MNSEVILFLMSVYHLPSLLKCYTWDQSMFALNQTRMWANAQRDGRPAEYW